MRCFKCNNLIGEDQHDWVYFNNIMCIDCYNKILEEVNQAIKKGDEERKKQIEGILDD